MKSKSLLVVSLGAVLTASGWAQSLMRVQVPFEFSAGSDTLPAGEYRVSEQVPGVLKIAAQDGKRSIMLLANTKQRSDPSGSAELIFNRYGSRYFLSEVWHPLNDKGYELRKTKAENEFAGLAAPKKTSVAAAIR